jgi:hypothetical protein
MRRRLPLLAPKPKYALAVGKSAFGSDLTKVRAAFDRRVDPGCSLIPGLRSRLSTNILAGFRVLSAAGACPPHDGVG